jgi:hypothetical protein
MTTQYTPILKLALPVQGELSGTWGDVVNDNITSMVEQAIAGLSVVNTWTTNSHTLTTANGTTAESRAAMLSLTDSGTALTGAGSVICPALSKVYIVKNGTAEIITVKTAAGSGIAVPVGKTMLVYCDGTNVLEAVDHVVTLSAGTLTVTGAATFSGDIDVDGTTNLDVVDIDGAVDMASTLTVAGTLSSAGGLVHQGDANTSLDFGTDQQTFYVGGVRALDLSTTGAVFNEGSADADFRVESDNDTHALFVQGSDGKVGIGTSSPAAPLEIKLAGDATADIFKFQRSDGLVAGVLNYNGTDGAISLGTTTAHPLAFDTNNVERMRIDASGNVGIGTDSPTSPNDATTFVHIGNATNQDTSIVLQDAVETWEIYQNDDLSFLFDTTNVMTLQRLTGNVGIGNSLPLGRLTISNAAGANAPSTVTAANTYLQLGSDDYGPSNNGKFMIGFGFTDATNTNSPAYIGYEEVSTSGDTYGDLTFYTRSVTTDTAPTERMRIEAGSGITTYPVASGTFVINENGVDADFRVESDSNTHMLFVDASTDTVNIGSATNYAHTFAVEGGKSVSNGIPYYQLAVVDNSSLATGNGGAIYFWGTYTSAGDKVEGASIEAYKANSTSANYQYGLSFKTRTHGSTNIERLFLDQTGATFNDTGVDADFRVESDTNANMLFVDASTDTVNIGGTAAGANVISMDAGRIRLNKSSDWNIESDGGTAHIRFLQSGVENGSITTDGTNTTYATSSDYRLKENIVDAPSASDDIDAIQVRSFDWKANGSHQVYGLIAQELLPILPNAVAQGEKEEDMMGVDYSKLVPMLIKEIQSLRARVADLES